MSRGLSFAFALTVLTLNVNGSEYSEHPRLPDDILEIAQKASDDFNAQRYDAAAVDYKRIIHQYPDSLYAWSNLGVVRSQQNHLAEANEAFAHALKLQPTDAFSLAASGRV